MRVRRLFLFLTTAFMLFSISAVSYAQGRYRDRDWRNNNNYNSRTVINSAKRVDKLSGQLKNDLDRALDRSRLDGRNREDQVNMMANEFHSVAARFRDIIDNGRDLSYASREAQRLLDLGWRLDRVIGRNRFDSRVESKWSQIRSDLQVIQNAYNGYGYR